MERIEALINKLKEQFEQQADPAMMLGTVQLLQFELSKHQTTGQQSLGTAKVAVVLPAAKEVKVTGVPAEYEKFAPKPVEDQPKVKETKETLLIDEGTLSVLQKNGQLDMVFDPMSEIPTFSHQMKEKEINETAGQQDSINEKLKQGKTELIEVLKESPVKDLRKAIGINDRFVFISELFRGDESVYERSIKTINNFSIYPEAEYWINRELKVKLGWNNDNPTVQHFDQLVRRRFS
jgi:hypothetical protein